eukprot:gnl/Chilomastix_cuspidata/4450.p1 GENE.gnl/Chilomastix_cuspidata/4450~~gnl/Chilomastix_cuspidata/4450.p1  ORF type:complete len:516 (+),score=177.59 gnl/Chilomastix_cuspidata/4450:166-1713(+)
MMANPEKLRVKNHNLFFNFEKLKLISSEQKPKNDTCITSDLFFEYVFPEGITKENTLEHYDDPRIREKLQNTEKQLKKELDEKKVPKQASIDSEEIRDAEVLLNNELRILDELLMGFGDVLSHDISELLKKELLQAKEIIDVEEEIREELRADLEKEAEPARASNPNEQLHAVRQHIEAYETFSSEIELPDVVADQRRVLDFCVARVITGVEHRMAMQVRSFSSFPTALRLPEVVRAATAETENVAGLPVCLSARIPFRLQLPPDFSGSALAVSESGLLAAFSNKRHALHLFDLCSRVLVCQICGFSAESFVACYGGEVFVGTVGESQIRHAPERRLVEAPQLTTFSDTKVPVIESSTAETSATSWTGQLQFLSGGQPYTFFARDRTARPLWCGGFATRILRRSGVHLGHVDCVVQLSGSDGPHVPVGQMLDHAAALDLQGRAPQVLIESSSAPAELAKAAFVCDSKDVVARGGCQQAWGLRSVYVQTLTRLFRDVFLFFDSNSKSVMVARFVVE